jgi:hypothetical protein
MTSNQDATSAMLAEAAAHSEAFIIKLPNEMLHKILGFAFTSRGPHRDQPPLSKYATMRATSTVCKLLYALTIQHLYKSVDLAQDRSKGKWTAANSTLNRFYRSLHENSALRTLCHHLQFCLHQYDHDNLLKKEEKMAVIMSRLLKGLPNLRTFHLKVPDFECIERDSPERLFLMETNALRSLHISGFGMDMLPPIQLIQRDLYTQDFQLESLFLEFVTSEDKMIPWKTVCWMTLRKTSMLILNRALKVQLTSLT